jgi:hypothetical protein
MSSDVAQAAYERLRDAYNEKVLELWAMREHLARKRYALHPATVTNETLARDRALLNAREDRQLTLDQIAMEFGLTSREAVRQRLYHASLRRPGLVHFPRGSIDDLLEG